MELILVTGGARSGKSSYAERVARSLGGDDVTYVATATAGDADMAERIRRHREERPRAWTTREAPRRAGDAVGKAKSAVVLLDCLTLLATNAFLAQVDAGEKVARAGVHEEVDGLLEAVRSRSGTLIVVTNEVGLGVVPASEMGRWFRDALGEANRRIAAEADEVSLMVSGIPLSIRSRHRA